jgi:glycosyltransferase involved in cell wall biosynthesis
MHTSLPTISVIICTRNRAALLEKCLLSVEGQTLEASAFEVLVVDNGSSDATPLVLKKFSERLPLTTIPEPVIGLSRARNTGWQAAKSDFIAFLDDDAMADPDWLASGLRSFQTVRPIPAAMTGPIRLAWEQSAPVWLTTDIQGCLGRLDFGADARKFSGTEETLIGANCFFHRGILERFGGFNERLGRLNTVLLSGEETLLQRQIENAGEYLWYDPQASIRHWVPPTRTTPGWFYRRYYWGGVSDYFMNKILGPVTGSPGTHHEYGRLQRVIKNIIDSSGLASQTEVVHGRIYVSYVAGWFAGSLKWQRMRNMELSAGLHEQ